MAKIFYFTSAFTTRQLLEILLIWVIETLNLWEGEMYTGEMVEGDRYKRDKGKEGRELKICKESLQQTFSNSIR
jgi:hypothetical protein